MNRYRVWLLAAVLAMSVPFLVAPAQAWEFMMDGNFTWQYTIRGQTGRAGFFGPYDVDNGAGGAGGAVPSSPGVFAPFNAWIGQPDTAANAAVVSGSDGAWNTMYMTTNMELRINPAVRIRGRYYIGEWSVAPAVPGGFAANDIGEGFLVASEYLNNRFPGVQRSFSPGYWNLLWMTAQLPWGEVALGKRPSSFGMGLMYNGEENRTSESLSLTAFYGPLRIGFSCYPARRASGTAGQYYNLDFDKNNGRLYDLGFPTVTYRNGAVDTGFVINWGSMRHRGGEGVLTEPVTRITTRRTQDQDEYYGSAYFKYNNGRFFFNVEGTFDQITQRIRQATAAGTPVILPFRTAGTLATQDSYVESWRGAVELGTLCGPTKVALLYSWLSGPDRRAGKQIDKTGLMSANVSETASVTWGSAPWSNTGLFRPYNYLMIYAFGLGTHINSDTDKGWAEDASIYAGRVDYAVAANLNVYGSFMWADRVSKSGYGVGFLRPSLATAGAINHQDRYLAPSIPDTNLGWEVDAGFDWKLLEGLLVNATFAYWKPGKWWNYACIDKSIPGWNVAETGPGPNTLGFGWGVNPSRPIDPIYGVEVKVTGQF